MNHCGFKGYLVDASGVIPDDPTDLGVEWLPIIGCSHLWCARCKVQVRNSISGSSRLYECNCEKWTESFHHPLFTEDPEPERDPTMPWACAGHPPVELPRTVDGVEIRDDSELATITNRVLDGWHPPGARAEDQPQVSWLRRLYVRLASTHHHVVTDVAHARIGDFDPSVRGRAIAVFSVVGNAAALERLLPLVEKPRGLYAGASDPITAIRNETLEDSIWRALAVVARKSPTKELVRAAGLTSGRGSRALYDVLSETDPDWVIENVEALALATPARVDQLCGSFAAFPPGKPIKATRERARAAITGS